MTYRNMIWRIYHGIILAVCILVTETESATPTITNLPLTSPTFLTVTENSNLGATIFTVAGSDADGDTLTYTIVYTTAGGTSLFFLDSTSGAVSLSTSTRLNFEALATTTYDIQLYASDGSTSTSETLQIVIGDVPEAPAFPQTMYSTSVDEGPASTTFLTFSFGATDDDGDTVSYSMTCGSYSSRFSMVPTSGALSYTQAYDLDAVGTPTSVTCTVTASDGSLSRTATLVIYINSLNDNTPAFQQATYTFVTYSGYSVGTIVGTVTAIDADLDAAYGAVTYTVDVSALADIYFGVTTAGEIFFNKDLSSYQGTGASFLFSAIATDSGSQSDTATVNVILTATTTVVTTTTTVRYLTFFDDTRSIVWFSLCMTAAFAVLILLCFYCWYLHWAVRILAMIRKVLKLCVCHCNCPERKPPKKRPVKEPTPPPTPPPSPKPAPLPPKPNPEPRPWDFWTRTGDMF